MKKFLFALALTFVSVLSAQESIVNKVEEQDKLLDALGDEMMSIRLTVQSLQEDNKNLSLYSAQMEKAVESCNAKIEAMEENIASIKKALESNKEDTHEIIFVLGDMQEELDRYKAYVSQMESRLKRANIFVNALIPIACVPSIVGGVCLYANGRESEGKLLIGCGVATLVCAEIAWNGGRLVLKLW